MLGYLAGRGGQCELSGSNIFGLKYSDISGCLVQIVVACTAGMKMAVAYTSQSGLITPFLLALILSARKKFTRRTKGFLMSIKWVRVLIGPEGRPIRIFRNKDWLDFPVEQVPLMTKAEAVGSIREQVFERARNPETRQFECENCGRVITRANGEMNERRPKGARGGFTGGEVSLDNCEALCHSCHQSGPDSRHGDRRWQTAKLRTTND